MCFFGGISENCMYCTWFLMDKDSSDLFHCNNLELCYECSYCNKCYDLNFGYFCTNCRNSWFLVDCKDCQDCFGCSNLKHKRYCWFNEEVGEKEFKKRLNAVELSDFEVLEKYKKKFAEEVLPKASFQALDIDQYSEDCEGHHIWSSKNCVECFDVQDSEDLKYSRDVAAKFRDSHDVAYTGLDAEMCYEQIAGGEKIQNARFNLFSGFTSLNIDYCDYCGVLENCFGCVGLRKKKFCILNKQYSESDYWKLLDRIKCDMLDRKEYGEFPPFAYATHPYIDSCATEDFDLDQKEFEDILKKDNEYFDIERKSLLGYGTPNNKNNSDAHNFAGDEDLWSDEKILNTTFACEETGQPFKIQKQELEFYKKKGLPLPRLHPETRHRNRFEWRGDRKILDGKCGDCGKTVKTIYPPDFTGKVCCDECYSKSMQ